MEKKKMSILNDYRRYVTDEEYEEWKQELKWEYRYEEHENDYDYYDDKNFENDIDN